MGSFLDSPDGLVKLGATAVGGAVGGPVGAGIANFGASALGGADPMAALQSGVMSGMGSGAGGVAGSATPTASSFGTDFLNGITNGLGFGNVAAPAKKASSSLLDSLKLAPVLPSVGDLNFTPSRPSLLDTLNFKGAY